MRLILIAGALGLVVHGYGAEAQTFDQEADRGAPASEKTAAPSGDIIVTGERTAYRPADTSFGAKASTDPLRLPTTVNAVTRDLIQDRQPRTFNEALRTVPGVNARFGRIGSQNLRVRGFDLRNFGEYRNGLRRFQDFNIAPEIANIDRFEVLKGPASVLYGISGPGGLLNIVTVTPARGASAGGALEFSGGNFDFYRAVGDATVPLAGDTLALRLTGSYESASGIQDFVDQDTALLSAAIAYRPTDATELIIDAEYLRADYGGNVQGLPADGVALPSPNGGIPRRRAIFDPNFNLLDRDQFNLGYRLTHRASDQLRLQAGFLYATTFRNRLQESFATGFVGGFTGPRSQVTRSARTRTTDWSSYAGDVNALVTWRTGAIGHEMLIGADYYQSRVEDLAIDQNIPALDLNNPVYRVQATGAPRVAISARGRQEWLGVYLQHSLLFLNDRLRVTGGVRYSSIETRNENRINAAQSRTVSDEPLTWRAGAIWNVIDPLSLFVSYSENFAPVLGATRAGEAFAPEEGRSYEGGVKARLFGGGADLTVSLFDIERANVTNPDPDNPGFNIQTGRQKSRGVEVELVGKLTPEFAISAAYAYLDTAITADTSLLIGQPFQGTPEHNGAVYAKYTIGSGPLRGLGLGAGVFFETERQGQLVTRAQPTSGFEVEGYARLDATLSYTRGSWETALAVVNLTDRDYVSGVIGRTIVYRGEPRTATLSLRRRF